MTTNTHPELPPMPDTNKKMVLPYTAIRYVAGYPESYVKEYARAYALLCRNAALEEAYGGDHFDTQPRGAPFNPLNHEQTK